MSLRVRCVLLVAPATALAACSGSSGDDTAPAAGAAPSAATPTGAAARAALVPDGSPLGAPPETQPGPDQVEPRCADFARGATCTTVGVIRWVLTTQGSRWTLTEYDYGDDFWVPGLIASGEGQPPRVQAVDLGPAEQPESLVLYPTSFDVVSTGEAGVPEVVAHVDGRPVVQGNRVVVGDKHIRQEPSGSWVLAS